MATRPHFTCQQCGETYDPEDSKACRCSQAGSPDPWALCSTDEWIDEDDEYRRSKSRKFPSSK